MPRTSAPRRRETRVNSPGANARYPGSSRDGVPTRAVVVVLLALLAEIIPAQAAPPETAPPSDDIGPELWLRFESPAELTHLLRRHRAVELVGETAGELTVLQDVPGRQTDATASDERNRSVTALPQASVGKSVPLRSVRAARFDGHGSIAFTRRKSNHPPLREGFTWEGFFWLSPRAEVGVDGAVAARLISQFADDRGTSTRLTVGLSAPAKGKPPRLCLAFAGTENLFVGKTDVTPAAWHHFAVVHEGTEQKGELRWYLDHRLQGVVPLDGRTDRSRLKPPGTAPIAIGARTLGADGTTVDRGFAGVIDEIRLHAKPLPVDRFLRARRPRFERPVRLLLAEDLSPEVPARDRLAQLASIATSQRVPAATEDAPTELFDEALSIEAMGLTALPPRFAGLGFERPRTACTGVVLDVAAALPTGPIELWLRSRNDVWLMRDDRRLAALVDANVHGPLPALSRTLREVVVRFQSDGKRHRFVALAVIEADDADEGVLLAMAWRPVGQSTWHFLGAQPPQVFDPATWSAFDARLQTDFAASANRLRRAAAQREQRAWQRRHAWARQLAKRWGVPFEKRLEALRTQPRQSAPSGMGAGLRGDSGTAADTAATTAAAPPTNPIDVFLQADFLRAGVEPAPLVDDLAFFRRLSLDARGRVPTLDEVQEFLRAPAATRRVEAIDHVLQSDEWADAWVGYWQDVLAENPTILKPDMNNSGAFRWWLVRALRENRPWDRIVFELLRMEGPDEAGGTSGFAKAAKNDAPMAMKAHVVLQAFMGVDLKCARCHDSPLAPLTQRDLFSVAALLNGAPLTVPSTSVIATLPGGRQPAVTKSLTAGETIPPSWPLQGRFRVLRDLVPEPPQWSDHRGALRRIPPPVRERLAAVLTNPASRRFSDVMVNRVWRRYFGRGFVEPVDDWNENHPIAHPDLFGWLSWQFVAHGYDVKWLARMIFTSRAYQRQATQSLQEWADADAPALDGVFAAQLRRRMTAEQIVDSLHTVVGKPFEGEELTFDPAGKRGFLNLGLPRRAWQLTSMSNERDRPALAMPLNQAIVDVLTTFGWRETRPTPLTVRDTAPNPLQPLMLANGLLVWRLVRLTEDSPLTERCLEVGSPQELVDELFLRVLSRRPNDAERAAFVAELADVFASRKTGRPKASIKPIQLARVDWEKHLKPEATLEILEAARRVREGEPPTVRLTTAFRERVEDMIWALINSPEFVFVP
ncbi:MAG: DUF1553 domain-containing protein [Planctomycetota bacterium]|nr:MAG: DUF1553 domain-containing protein [Planctomycetota bacterium]